MEELAKEMGFESEQEMHKLIASVDLSDPDKLHKFMNWKENDGTKKGLLHVIDEVRLG